MAFTREFIIDNLDILTHRRDGFKNVMLEAEDLERACPLDTGHHNRQEATVLMGQLDVLPAELLDMVLLDLDVRSLTTLRSVSRRLRLAVDALWQYREIVTHASSSLRAALSINLGASITCRRLHRELCSQRCAGCGRFGGYLHLLTCSRVCFVCLSEELQFLPLTPGHARVAFGLDRKEIARLPTAVTIPGVYSQFHLQRKRTCLVDRTAARLAGIKLHKSIEGMEEFVSNVQAEKTRIYETKVRASHNVDFYSPRRPPYTDMIDKQGGNPYRFMCAVTFPWLDHSTGEAEWGLKCTACRDLFYDLTEDRQDWRWSFTEDGFVEHVQHCKKSMDILALISRAEKELWPLLAGT